MAKSSGKFIQKATARMKQKGTLGSFGKATPAKIARAKKEGGLQEKRAVFAENMKKIATKHKREGHSRPRKDPKPHSGTTRHLRKTRGDVSSHKAITAQSGYSHL